jgi:xylulose-5-phosphate/fructose-6-phosphate phosphoketolase
VPLSAARDDPAHLAALREWMLSYRPHELFDADGAPTLSIVDWLPRGELRMSANPHTNGGRYPRDLELPDYRGYGVKAGESAEATRVLGGWLREVMTANEPYRNFRIVGPDETESNRLGAVLDVTDKAWHAAVAPTDLHLGPHGRVMEILSEHTCQGWLEGYLLTGRHGLFSCYEAFVHIVDSMLNQHAKWLKVTRHLGWRKPIPSLNYPADLARVAPGPQRLLTPGPRLHRPRYEQKGRGRAGLPAAGHQHPALGGGSLPT